MWDNPRLLNFAANLLFGVAAFIVACIVVLSVLHSSFFPLRTLVIDGEVHSVDAQTLSEAIAGRVTGNFFAVNLEAVRTALEELPSVRHAYVQRQWPDRLRVELEEQVALARWDVQGEAKTKTQGEAKTKTDSAQLVNRYGELFRNTTTETLPRFSGPLGSEAKIAVRYGEFSSAVAPLNATITDVLLSPRSAWQLKLARKDQPALTLMLGRGEEDSVIAQRLTRFVHYYPQMQAQLQRSIQYVDLRYPHGFAVRVPEVEKKGGKV